MAYSTKFYGHWAQYDGRTITMHNAKYMLHCVVYKQLYPYEEEVISVTADAVDKTSADYLAWVDTLEDEWTVDILGSELDLAMAIWHQLQAR